MKETTMQKITTGGSTGLRLTHPCGRQIPAAFFTVAATTVGTMTLPCDRRRDHDGPHRVRVQVDGWRVTIEGEQA